MLKCLENVYIPLYIKYMFCLILANVKIPRRILDYQMKILRNIHIINLSCRSSNANATGVDGAVYVIPTRTGNKLKE